MLLAGLVYLPIVQILIGRSPGSIDGDRFRAAWLRLAESVFTGAGPT